MNYVELLKKYMQHVVDCEGVDYIESGGHHSEVKFTDEEWALLEAISAENDRDP